MKRSRKQLMAEVTESQMRNLAVKTGLQFDGGDGEDRLHFDEERINVFAHLMTRREYEAMCKKINSSSINRAHYTVYAWNDVSGYEYWKSQGERNDSNYIQVTVSIKNPAKVRPEQLKRDVQRLFWSLQGFDNLEQYFSDKGA